MSLKKAKTIVKAFLEPLPEGQDWYESRLEICKVCPHNSANKKDLTLAEKLNINKLLKNGLCDNGNHCTACGCCIERKCATKSEECGLAELDLVPKWEALEVASTLNKGMSVINLSPELGTITAEKSSFTYDFGIVKPNKLDFKFQVKRDTSKLKIKNYKPSCSCISVNNMSRIDAHTFELSVSMSTTGFRKGWNERKLFITYFERGSMIKELMIVFKVNRLDGK